MSARTSLPFDIDAVVSSYSDLILESWDKAFAKGLEDIVFVWMIEGEDLRTLCMTRESVLSAFRASDSSLPASALQEVTETIKTPAGEGKAWLVLSGPGFLSSTCIEYTKIVPPHLLS